MRLARPLPALARPRALARLAALAAAMATACGQPAPPAEPAAPAARIAPGPHPRAVLDLGQLGVILVELLPEVAPGTVAEFEELVRTGFYDGTTFHRVIPGFVIQGGDPLTRNLDPRDDGKGGAGRALPDEFSDLSHERGMVAMANRGAPHSAEGQFFIVHADSPALDGRYTVFGRVVEGMEVVDAVTELEIDKFGRYGPPDRPYPQDARIESIRLQPAEAGAAPPAPAGETG